MKWLSILVLTIFFGLSALAQDGATLSGNIEDQTGALIPGGRLILTNRTTGEIRHTESDDSGNFTFNNVTPSQYTLQAEAEGFKTAMLNIEVSAEPRASVKIKREISVEEQVTVRASQSQPPTSPESNADAVKFSINLLHSLPSQSQDILPILNNFLSPAAQGVKGPSIIIDGVEDSELNVPTGAIKLLYINKNPYSAEYRRPGLSRIAITTRNGSRKRYRGSVAFFLRNSIFDARSAFAAKKK